MPESLPALCDAELFERFLAGENRAYTTLYHRYAARVMGYINSLLGGENQAADDVFQETFLRLFRERNRIDHENRTPLLNVGGWLFRVARNLSLNQIRSESYLTELPVEFNPHLITTSGEAFPALFGEHLEEEELLRKVYKAVEALPPTLREVFVLREVNGMSYEETAAIIDCTMEATRMRLSRARSAIRQMLTPNTEKSNY
ncbi:MAG: RNA polymerase sigma factor [Ignavibacteriae bacterium]|nr:RNA polymerase sigma factor [Ignavibacteriota bacterium]MCB9216595.1 RNA polymerase sigma factor [Ignavibacteria bacterium]